MKQSSPQTRYDGAGATEGARRTLTVQMHLPSPLLSINARRRMHWRTQAKHTADQRHEAAWYGKLATPEFPAINPCPYLTGRVRVDITIHPHARQHRSDDTAVWEAAKPWLDGFEDAGIVTDDKQFVVGSLTWATERTGQMVIVLTEVEA